MVVTAHVGRRRLVQVPHLRAPVLGSHPAASLAGAAHAQSVTEVARPRASSSVLLQERRKP